MISKKEIVFIFFIWSILLVSFIVAQTPDETSVTGTTGGTDTTNDPTNPALPPGLPTAGGGLLGDFNPDTGKPRNLETFQKYGDYYKDREQNESFLMQEWTNLLVNNPIIGPALFYTDMFFAFFNPLWTTIFGVPFSWSWAFFLSLGIWIALIFIIYFSVHGLIDNILVDFVTSFIVATLIGISGAINRIVEFFSSFTTNLLILLIVIILLVILVFMYKQLLDSLAKESKKIELEQSEENIRSFGKVTRRGFKDS